MCYCWNCSVHLVELLGTGEYFAMKAMDKNVMLNRNKVWVQISNKRNSVVSTFDHFLSLWLSNAFRSIELLLSEKSLICWTTHSFRHYMDHFRYVVCIKASDHLKMMPDLLVSNVSFLLCPCGSILISTIWNSHVYVADKDTYMPHYWLLLWWGALFALG